ncbi:GH13354 [Drosophila grimshawi]|uniref:GH13354 n=1 Tax=Drosophila grimshawi TaxID=7222 RepID=B4JPQ4_DROGR|nr:GH13354 [Drosophila grimshawi]
MGISTEPSFLEVELPQTLLESPSTSTFLPDEEASVCPLLHSNNSALDPVLLSSHPLSPNIVANDITSSNISNTDCKAETSSSGSSDGIAMDAMESTSTNLFNKVNYHHLQNNNITTNQQVIAARSEKEVLDVVSESLEYWIDQGVNGFYLKGLDSLKNNAALSMCLSSWKRILGKNRVLIVEESIFKDKSKSEISLLLDDIDLVDVVLNVENNAIQMKERIQVALNKMPIGEEVTWVQWSLSEVKSDNSLPSSNLERIFPATIMQLTLPGTTNILHTNEVAIAQNNKNRLLTDQVIQHSDDGATDQQTDSEMVHRMISLRERSPAIYKSFICKSDSNKQNTQILAHSSADILIVVRNYPRKNSLVSVTNFGSTKVTVNLSSKFYSGIRMLMTETDEKIYFERLKMFAYDTVVVKLDK